MEMAKTVLTLQHKRAVARVAATRIRFSAHQCFARDGGADDRRCLRLLADHLKTCVSLAVYVRDGEFFGYLLKHCPDLRGDIRCIVRTGGQTSAADFDGIPVVRPEALPAEIRTVFLGETLTHPRMQMRKDLPQRVRVLEPDVLQEIGLRHLPARAWTPWARDIIYPIDVPEIEFEPGLDMLLIDCPARNLGLMPNGVGYVHNALKQVNIKHEARDLDIILYHRFHIRRLFDEGGTIRLPSGRTLPADPWQAEHYDLWSDPEILDYWEPEIQEIVAKIAAARPKVLGLSIHACNEHFSRTVVERVKAALPEVVILVGGFSCYSPDIGLRGFPLADYMCVGEADLTVGPLVARLAAGERPANTPGVLSRYDAPGAPFLPAPMPHDLDLIEHPRYEWYDLSVYRNYNGYQLTPVIASRGCRWSRCTFCAERFYWRIRSPKAFVDELEWLVGEGCRLFMFNESDLNGKPEIVLEICDEIIRRKLNVRLTGQLRIHKKSDRAFYQKLRQAGFVALRFGVDAFSENTLRLQKKGYTTATICQNLKDCWEAGIYTEVNWVIGVPGETDEDIEEGIELILRNKPYIGRLANLNPLILVTGGVYWLEPEKHSIHFRGDKEELYRAYPRAIPANLWYSNDPYIDENVRKRRFERIVLALHEGKFDVGAWAARVIEDVQKNRDVARTGGDQSAVSVSRDAERSAEATAAQDTAEGGASRPGLSDGVGRMQKPAPAEGQTTLEFNADARSSAYVFRAGSALPEDAVTQLRPQLYIVRSEDELFGIEPEALEAGFDRGQFPPPAADGGSIDLGAAIRVRFVSTPAARAELIQSVKPYNIVSYDGLYYALPQDLGEVTWGEQDVAAMPGVITGKKLSDVFNRFEQTVAGRDKSTGIALSAPKQPLLLRLRLLAIRGRHKLRRMAARFLASWKTSAAAAGATSPQAQCEDAAAKRPLRSLKTVDAPPHRSLPILVGSLEGYNVVEYEGWFYGMPQSLGPIDLGQTDVIETPGVIRDLSRDVVENEIREVVAARKSAA
jgi:radical SAM superfamily enzyme YgiQ (UPF0313 family)